MFGFLPGTVGYDLKASYSFGAGPFAVYWFTGTDAFHAKETRPFSSQVNARQKTMSLKHEAMMKILKAPGGCWAHRICDGENVKDVLKFYPIVWSY